MTTPLVFASSTALAHAERVLPGRVIEVEVSRAIVAGAVTVKRGVGYVWGDGWKATCVRVPGKRRPRPRGWLITGVFEVRVGVRRAPSRAGGRVQRGRARANVQRRSEQ